MAALAAPQAQNPKAAGAAFSLPRLRVGVLVLRWLTLSLPRSTRSCISGIVGAKPDKEAHCGAGPEVVEGCRVHRGLSVFQQPSVRFPERGSALR